MSQRAPPRMPRILQQARQRLLDSLSTSPLGLGETSLNAELTALLNDYLEVANSHALLLLSRGDLRDANDLLREAEGLGGLAPSSPLAAVTANNLACCHRRRGNLKGALACLRKAVQIESRTGMVANDAMAETQINLCVVHSELGSHDLARQHAAKAVDIMEEDAGAVPVFHPHPASPSLTSPCPARCESLHTWTMRTHQRPHPMFQPSQIRSASCLPSAWPCTPPQCTTSL